MGNSSPRTRMVLSLVFVATLAARLPALRAWWCLDDWGLLAGAAGLVEPGSARWLSQRVFWLAAWPAFGLGAIAHASLRIVLHAASAVLVARIGIRSGLPPRTAALAGLVYGAGPVSFTPVYWASGIQELLGVGLALAAVDRWLAGGRRNLVAAVSCGVGAILSKEAAFGLPALFALLLLVSPPPRDRRRRDGWIAVAALSIAATGEGLLVLGHFARGEADPYALGGIRSVLGNLAKFGWWLATPAPVFTSRITVPVIAGGAAVWVAWVGMAAWRWRRGDRLAAAACAAAVLSLGPALPLVRQTHPYLACAAAAAGSLALASLVPRRLVEGRLVIVAAAVAASAWGWLAMETRIANVNDRGRPADPVVRATKLSVDASAAIRRAAADDPAGIVLLQPPISAEQARRSATDPAAAVTASPRWSALGGDLGPRLLAGPGLPVRWTTSLADVRSHERVLCESARELRDWGGADSALFYAVILDVGLGHFDRATSHLRRAAALGADANLFIYDEDRSSARDMARRRLPAFSDWLTAAADAGRLARPDADAFRATAILLVAG